MKRKAHIEGVTPYWKILGKKILKLTFCVSGRQFNITNHKTEIKNIDENENETSFCCQRNYEIIPPKL